VVRQEYKETGVGEIPVDWSVENFDHVTSVITCGVAATPKYVPEGKGVPFLSSTNVKRGKVIWKNHKYISNELHASLYRNNPPNKGDLLYSRVGSIGEAAVIKSEIEFSIYVSLTLIKLKNKLHNEYVAQLLNSDPYKALANGTVYLGGGVGNLNVGVVRSFPIVFPDIEEQKAIAGALSDADALIESLEKLIAKKRAIKTATMQELLTGKTRLPGFEGNWEKCPIGSFTTLKAGGTPSTKINEYWGGDILWMSSGELHLKFVQDVQGRITNRGLQESAATLLPKNCVLIGLAGQGKTRGTAALNRVPLTTNQSVAAIYPSKKHSSEFLFYNIDSRYEKLRELSSGDGGRGGLNLTILSKIKVSMPCFKEQQAIADVLLDIDRELTSLETKLRNLKGIKQGMIQELLTGRTRLVS